MEAIFQSHLLSVVSASSKSTRRLTSLQSKDNSKQERTEFCNDFDKYPYIVVGSGMGGGMLVRKLMNDYDDSGNKAEPKPNVLLFEGGGVGFHTHCLNTSRIHFEHQSQDGPGRDNEAMFNRYLGANGTKYVLEDSSEESLCGGGSVFELGGKSLFWSLEAPNIRDDRFKYFFPETIANDLNDTQHEEPYTSTTGEQGTITQTREGWYTKALRVLTNTPPGQLAYPREDVSSTTTGQVSEARLRLDEALGEFRVAETTSYSTPNGAEFPDINDLYYFAQNAYSTVDWIFDRAYNQPVGDDQPFAAAISKPLEKFTVKGGRVTELKFEKTEPFYVHEDQKVILCAGTVNTAAIAMRSDGLPGALQNRIGKNLTDHEIWVNRYWKKIEKDKYEAGKAIELCSYVKVHGHEALLTVCLHAEKFYGHGFADGKEGTDANNELVEVINILIEFESELNPKGKVIVEGDETKIRINRQPLDSSQEFQTEIQNLCKAIREGFGFTGSSENESGDDKVHLSPWGAVGHEVGTMRMDGANDNDGVVDSNLKVKGVDNLYVCDLSVFPCSPMENPSLTLSALAMRLADHLKSQAKK